MCGVSTVWMTYERMQRHLSARYLQGLAKTNLTITKDETARMGWQLQLE